MRSKLSNIISIISILIALILTSWVSFLGGRRGLEGVAWILGILGAPVTFLDFLLYKFNITQGFIASFIVIVFLYLLQYQLLALLFKKNILNFKTKLGLFLSLVSIGLIIISGIIMFSIIFAKPNF